MFHTRVRSDSVGRRLDAGFYNPEYVAAQNAISRFPLRTMESLRADGAPIGYGVLKPRFQESSVRMVRIQDFSDPFVDLDSSASIDPLQMKQFSRSACVRGDLLVAIGGYPGRLGLLPALPDGATAVNINQHVVRVRFAEGVERYFVTAFLMSATGHRILSRQVSGSVQAGINVEDFRLITIPFVSADPQHYIGAKVRQAEQLRERGRQLEAVVAKAHAQYIVPPTGIDFAKRTRRLAARSLTERLDAHFYPSAVEQYFLQLSGPTRSLERLCSLVVNGQSQPEAEDGVRQATVANLGRSFVEGSLRIVERPADGSRALAPHDLLLCNAAHNKSYIGRDVTYSQVEGAYPSTEVMVIRVDRSQIPASFVRHYLKTEIGYLQVQSTIRGITAHSYPTDVKLLEIPIPAVPDVDREAWFATDDKMLAAGHRYVGAKLLSDAAKVLVENLIHGRLAEADLVAAQKALEAGDRSADREILKSLRDSDAPDAKPLIADVDALYALLDGTEGQAS